MNRHFSFKLKDDVVRGMNRQQYKAASHYARYVARCVDQKLDWDKFIQHITDVFVYGRSDIRIEDLLL